MSTTPTIALFCGGEFNFIEPERSNFNIKDVAKGLSNTCRFGGQPDRFYSVAEHSVLTSRIVPQEHAWSALMHDAAEAFLGDMPTPLKNLIPDYKELEHRAEVFMSEIYHYQFPKHPIVKQADTAMYHAERSQVMHLFLNPGDDVANVKIEFWGPEEASRRFLERFNELQPRPHMS